MPGKLCYFGLGGRAESIRALIAHKGDFQFEDERVDFAKLGEWKASGYAPMGSLPIWDEDGLVIMQGNAIMRMLGIRFGGYYSEDPQIAYNIDSLMDFQEDILGKFGGYLFPAVTGSGEIGSGSVSREQHMTLFWDKQIEVVTRRL